MKISPHLNHTPKHGQNKTMTSQWKAENRAVYMNWKYYLCRTYKQSKISFYSHIYM